MKINQYETAIAAFYDHVGTGKAQQQREKILSFIRGAGGDWSIGELAKCLRMEKSTVSARVNELLNDSKELDARPKRKDLVSGITIRPVAIPQEQMEIAL